MSKSDNMSDQNIYQESADRAAKFFESIKCYLVEMPSLKEMKLETALQAAFMDEAYRGRKALLEEENARLSNEVKAMEKRLREIA